MRFNKCLPNFKTICLLSALQVQTIKLVKSTSGMGLSIVAAKGIGKDRLGIYIKAVVEGGAAFYDGRLAAGDQLLRVDGQSLVGITQERAAEIMMPRQSLPIPLTATMLRRPTPTSKKLLFFNKCLPN